MKLVTLTAIKLSMIVMLATFFTASRPLCAAVASNPVVEQNPWPWQVGKVYNYEVTSHTLTNFEQAPNNGNAFKTQFIISVKAPGHLLAKLENSQYVHIKEQLPDKYILPTDLKYEPYKNLDQTFEIFVNGGRVVSVNFPKTLSIALENVIKGLISALQVDLSTTGYVHTYPNNYDKENFQGVFKKMETDVSGECETLYSVSPISSEQRREISYFTSEENTIQVIRSMNYGHCHKRFSYLTGLPEGAVWEGIAYDNDEKQFIKQSAEYRFFIGKQGSIYGSEGLSTVTVSPLIYGNQKVEVLTYVKFALTTITEDNSATWQMTNEFRSVNSLLYTTDPHLRMYTYGDKQNIAKAQQILQEITPLLQDPNTMPKGNFLVKFELLTYLLGSFTTEQLTQLTTSVEVAKTSKNVAKNNMWIIYRDAVAQVGTPAAFQQIKSWVSSKKVEGNEAAQLITAIGASIAKPSKTLLEEFFNFATSEEVKNAPYVNNSALLASTKLLRFAADDKFIVETVIPYLSKELKHAVETGASSNAVVYVVVLGNLAHPAVLNVFAPYLEGQIPVTKYLRTQMVTNLKNLANRKDPYVRSLLYSIIINTAEVYEVRVAAVLNIFMTYPTYDMMRILAHIATVDPSTQVRSAIKSGILFASKLKEPRFTVLAKTAQSVLDVLSEEDLGHRYSTDSLVDGYGGNDGYFSYFRELSYIGSENYGLPKYQRNALRFMGTGLTDENQLTISATDVQDLLQYFVKSIFEASKEEAPFKFSAKQIIEQLNLKRKTREPIQGTLFVENLNQQKLLTFSEEDFVAFIDNAATTWEELLSGTDIQYTKILNKKKIVVIFPLINGMPFMFDYDEPIVFNIKARSVVDLNQTTAFKTGSLENTIDFTFGRTISGYAGHVDTLGDLAASAGVVSNIQFHVPLKLNTDFATGFVKVQFEQLNPEKDVNLVHFSVWPYTAVQKKGAITWDALYIERPVKTVSLDFKVGYWTGVMYQIQASSYSNDYKNFKSLYETDILTKLGSLLYQKDIALTQFNYRYLGSESTAKSVAFTVHFDTLYNQKNAGELGQATPTEHVEANSQARREEFTKKVSAGIEAARVELADISIIFNGPKKVEYLFTAAFAYSYVDPKFQAGFFSHYTNSQVNAVFKYDESKAKIVPLNFEEALKNDIKVTFEADLNYGKTNVNLQGYGVRSNEYAELLKQDPVGKRCLLEMTKDNYYQLDCHKMILKAHAPDYFKASIAYKNFNPSVAGSDYIYKAFKEAYSWDEEANPLQTISEDKLEIEARAFYYENYVNYKFLSKYGQLKLEKAEGLWYYPYAMAVYGPSRPWERAMNYYYGYQYLPHCAIDGNKIWTFSGRSYEYTLPSSWHVVMVDQGSELGQDLVILARRQAPQQEEVYISYRTESGKYVELDLKPSTFDIKTNGNKTNEGALTMYWDEDEDAPLLEYYDLAEGVQVFNFRNSQLRVVYDKQRLVIFTDEHRSTTRGLCGQSTGQVQDDYMTPWGLVDRADHYGASFALDENCEPKTLALKTEAKSKAYQPVIKFTKIPHYDPDWNKTTNKSL